MRAIALALLVGLLTAPEAEGGSYLGTTVCTIATGCAVGHPLSQPSNNVNPQSIVHPRPFQQAGGVAYTVRICTNELDLSGVPAATQWAIDTWNALEPRTENCHRCTTWEEPANQEDFFFMTTTMLHELGHCALALAHPNRIWDPQNDGTYENTSFTMSWDAGPNGIQPGPDGLRGSFDDTQQSVLGGPAQSVSWFRIADNDPVVVDPVTIVDTFSYSRSLSNLPSGHSWGANANRRVGQSLGHATTQATMYGLQDRAMNVWALSADDVNMQLMARTGVDLVWNTVDDYDVVLTMVPCTSPHEVEVQFVPLGVTGPVGNCAYDVDYAYPQNPALARVFKLVPHAQLGTNLIRINSDYVFDVSLPSFSDGFESGNTAAWSASMP